MGSMLETFKRVPIVRSRGGSSLGSFTRGKEGHLRLTEILEDGGELTAEDAGAEDEDALRPLLQLHDVVGGDDAVPVHREAGVLPGWREAEGEGEKKRLVARSDEHGAACARAVRLQGR